MPGIYTKNLCKHLVYRGFHGDRDRIQTCNPHIRSVVLYSVELRSHWFSLASAKIGNFLKLQSLLEKKVYYVDWSIS